MFLRLSERSLVIFWNICGAKRKRLGWPRVVADRTARTVGKAVQVAREELSELTKQVEALARELKKTRKRLKRAIR